MLEMISNSNPLILLAIGVVIVFVFMFVFIKPDKKKSKKSGKETEKKQDVVKKEKPEEETKEKPEITKSETAEGESVVSEDVEEKKKQTKKTQDKPEITQVYKRTEKIEVPEEKKSDDGISDELLSRAQFVNNSKNISKFVGFKNNDLTESNNELLYDDGLISEEFSDELAGDCEDCKRIVKHFDHSRRLSKIIKDDSFDQMFMEHLTDKYMKIDVDRHLKSIDQKIYERASEMLSNSSAKILVDDEDSDIPIDKMKNDRDFMKSWLENRKRQEQINLMAGMSDDIEDVVQNKMIMNDLRLNAKNLVMAEVVMNRKSLRRNKK